ncbi:MAG: tetratricopeptide repeat protein, partial [Marinirhabdus sp.]
MKAVHLLFILLFGITLSVKTHAQEEDPPTDDLGNVSDAFQEYFFEALKQKGIENYERALVALNKAKTEAEKKQVNQAVVYFEMAKNLSRLERYDEAIENFKKVRNTEKDNIAVLEGMYDAYYQQANYAQAIPIVQLLAKHNADYKEDLLNLYHSTKQYDKALSLLDDLDESWGESPQRNVLRRQIYKITGNSQAAITNLKDKIGKHPKNEQDYLNLIFLYSEQGEKEKAFATAETLLKNEPKSELVHLALYKFYLDKGETENALNSMSVVFAASQIETKSKYQVLSDFISFVEKNPVYEAKLLETVAQLGE